MKLSLSFFAALFLFTIIVILLRLLSAAGIIIPAIISIVISVIISVIAHDA